MELATWGREGVDSFMPQQDCQVGTNSEMFSLAYSLYLGLRNFDTRGIQKGRIINGLIFPSKIQKHLSKAKKAMELLDVFIPLKFFK